MSQAIELSLGQKFEIERFNRAIDASADPAELRQIAKQLLTAWQTQKAATDWVMQQQLGAPPRVRSLPAAEDGGNTEHG
jgi:hypothetical protein